MTLKPATRLFPLQTYQPGKFIRQLTAITTCLLTSASFLAPVTAAENQSNAGQVPAANTSGERKKTVRWKPGVELSFGTESEDIVPTDDVPLARKQVKAYPDSPEASFILAVALTRTSHVEEALMEVRRAKKLAEKQGGPVYFDKMIAQYEELLKNYPDDDRVRYGLSWAYYMKAYLLAKQSARVARWKKANPGVLDNVQPGKSANNDLERTKNLARAAGVKVPDKIKPIAGPLDRCDPADRPKIRKYYELALEKLENLLEHKPDDVWATVYHAFLKAEYTGNIDEAMTTWRHCRDAHPNNPAPYFFLGEAYLKKGNLKKCLNNVSKAIALRSIGN